MKQIMKNIFSKAAMIAVLALASVTVTQAAPVNDYAPLPFEFDGGKAAIAETAGLSQDGLGDDYENSPKLHFDSVGDWVLLQLDERPGILTFDFKGVVEDGDWDGRLTMQTSADGETFNDVVFFSGLSTAIESETIDNLGENVRYIRWIFTEKANGDVALGNIKLAQYDESAFYTVSWTPDAHSELFVFRGDDESAPLENGASVPEGTTVKVSVDVYDFFYQFGSLSVKDAEGNDLELTVIEPDSYFSFEMPASNVTITITTMVIPVVDYATLPFEFDGGYYDIDITSGLTQEGLDIDYESSPKLNFDSHDDWLILQIDEAPGTLTYDIRGDGFADGTFKVRTSVDGEKYFDLKVYRELGDTQSEEFVLPRDVRYIKWVYDDKGSGNVAVGNITLSAGSAPPTPPDTKTLTLGRREVGYWGSFYCGMASYQLPKGAQAFIMQDAKLNLLGSEGGGDGRMIPAGTAVIIIADKESVTLEKVDETGTVFGNVLRGSDTEFTATGYEVVLGKDDDGKVDFYRFTGETFPAGKAYYYGQ